MKHLKSYLSFLGIVVSLGLSSTGLMLMVFSLFFDSLKLTQVLLHIAVFLTGSIMMWSGKELFLFLADF